MMSAKPLQLYRWTASGHSAVALLCLRAKSLQYESVWVDLLSLEQYSPEILKLNPDGQVPILIHDGHVMTQTTAIAEYLDERFPAPSLVPATHLDRWRMRVWLKIFNEDLAPSIAQLAWFGVTRPHLGEDHIAKLRDAVAGIRIPERKGVWTLACAAQASQGELDFSRRKLQTVIARLELELSKSPWAAGPTVSLADLHLFPMLVPVKQLLPGELNLRATPHIIAWLDRMWEQPGTGETFSGAEAQDIMCRLAPGAEPVRWG